MGLEGFERPFESAGRAAAFLFSAVATSTAVPLDAWLVGTDAIARDEVFCRPVGTVTVAIARS